MRANLLKRKYLFIFSTFSLNSNFGEIHLQDGGHCRWKFGWNFRPLSNVITHHINLILKEPSQKTAKECCRHAHSRCLQRWLYEFAYMLVLPRIMQVKQISFFFNPILPVVFLSYWAWKVPPGPPQISESIDALVMKLGKFVARH